MKPSSISLIVAAGMVSALVGCSPAPSVVGKWKMDTTEIDKAMAPKGSTSGDNGSQALASAFAGMAKGLASAFTLQFNQDKTCQMNMILSVPGTYVVDGHSIKVHWNNPFQGMAQASGTPTQSSDAVFTISDDGSKLTTTNPNQAGTGSGGPATFIRDTSTK